MKTLARPAAVRLLVATGLLLALFLATAPPASAAPADSGPAVGAAPVSVITIPGTKPADGSAALAACPITFYGHTGLEICGFDHTGLDWGNGNIEWFIVGADYAIWHIWLNSGGWHSLGGQADRQAPNGAYTYTNPPGVATFGTDDRLWCRNWPWSAGWFPC